MEEAAWNKVAKSTRSIAVQFRDLIVQWMCACLPCEVSLQQYKGCFETAILGH
jgi:hypothetical protein